MSRTASFCLLILLFICPHLQATIFENRYIPFLQRPFLIVPDKKSYFGIDCFFATASNGFDNTGNEIGIPELTAFYDQQSVARSFVALGCENPLPAEFQNQQILWNTNGKLQAQGMEMVFNKHLFRHFYAGFYSYFMRVDTTSVFKLQKSYPDATVLLLDRVRRCMNVMAGLHTNDHASQVGFGDLDFYFMWARGWEYPYKFRSIFAQARLGTLMPSGKPRDIYEPTSIPFGTNGFWGIYGSAQGEFELKEDWKAGLFFRLTKLFSRNKTERVPLYCEPAQFSPFITNVHVSPGLFFTSQIWASFEHVHKGLGARAILTVRRHWKDERTFLCTLPLCDAGMQNCLEESSSWGSDYITLNVFYDFVKPDAYDRIAPIIFFAWDIPSSMLETRRILKTNKVILGLEFGF